MRMIKARLRSLEARAKRYFDPAFVRERWLAKHELKTVERDQQMGTSCVAGLAAIPSREDALSQMIDSVIGQFDHLYVYLNGFDEVPAFLDNDKISVFRSQETGDLGDVGKFFGTKFVSSGLYFTLDDDIVYPSDYRARMEACLRQFGNRAAVGVHGAFYSWNPGSFFDRQVIHYRAQNDEIRPVSILGTGTVCFSLDHLNVELDWFKTANMADIWFGGELKRRGLPALCIDRAEGWLQDAEVLAEQPVGNAIYEATRADPGPYNEALSEFLHWGRSDIAKRIHRYPVLWKRYGGIFSVTDYSQLIAEYEDEQRAQSSFYTELARLAHKQCAEQDALRYFDNYECELWSTYLVNKAAPDYALAMAVLKKAMPVVTEPAAEIAEHLMHKAAGQSNRRYMLRAALIYMRAKQRMEAFGAVEDAYKYILSFGEPSLQISLEYLTALLSLGRVEDARDHYQSSALHSKYPVLAGVIEWLCDPQRETLFTLVDSYLMLREAGLMRTFRSNIFKWVSLVRREGANPFPAENINKLISKIVCSSDGISAIKLMVQAGSRDVASLCYEAVLSRSGPKLSESVEFDLLGAFVAEPGRDVIDRLNEVYAKSGISTLMFSETGRFFEGVSSTVNRKFDGSLGAVTVIMTCKNASSTITYAINSILAQTYTDIELIVVDDGSTDSTAAIVKQFCNHDPRVHFLENQENIGIYASRNRAILASNGEFVAFQDADDYSHPQRIELQIKALLESDEVVASNSGHVRVSSSGEVCLENNLNVFGHGPVNWIYRRTVFDQLGLFKEVRTRGDIEFIRRVLLHYKQAQIQSIDLPLLLALHDQNTNSWRESRGEKARLLISQRQQHAKQHYVARHRSFN